MDRNLRDLLRVNDEDRADPEKLAARYHAIKRYLGVDSRQDCIELIQEDPLNEDVDKVLMVYPELEFLLTKPVEEKKGVSFFSRGHQPILPQVVSYFIAQQYGVRVQEYEDCFVNEGRYVIRTNTLLKMKKEGERFIAEIIEPKKEASKENIRTDFHNNRFGYSKGVFDMTDIVTGFAVMSKDFYQGNFSVPFKEAYALAPIFFNKLMGFNLERFDKEVNEALNKIQILLPGQKRWRDSYAVNNVYFSLSEHPHLRVDTSVLEHFCRVSDYRRP